MADLTPGDIDYRATLPVATVFAPTDEFAMWQGTNDLARAAFSAVIAYFTAQADAMVVKGSVNCAANPNYPAADAGHTYIVSVAGKIGGASGKDVEAGDVAICIVDATAAGNEAAVGANWIVVNRNIAALLASNIANAPAGNIAATTVQAALNELDAEKAALAGGATFTGAHVISGTSNTLSMEGSATFGGVAVATRVTTINNAGQITSRFDNAGASTHATLQNYGITAAGQGGVLAFNFGTGGALGAGAGTIGIYSTDTWASGGFRSAKWAVSLTNAGTSAERIAVLPDATLQLSANTVIDKNRRFVFGSPSEYTAAAIAAVGNAVNTTDKITGVTVWDTTNRRMLRARGPLAADPWDVVDGSASVTPS